MLEFRNRLKAFGVLTCCVVGCGSPSAPPPPPCPLQTPPTFELGTGEVQFAALSADQDLMMVRGSQGGCHFPLAFRAEGFPGSRTLVRYRIENLTDGQEIIASRQFIRLSPDPGRPGTCQSVNFTAFLIDPWEAEDDRVQIEVTLEEADVSATQAVTAVARWPNFVEGLDRDLWCGER